MIKAGITGIFMMVVLIGSHDLGYGGDHREFSTWRDLPPMPIEQAKTIREFLRRASKGGLPEECRLDLSPAWADPEDVRSYRMSCPKAIRVDD